MTVLIDLGNNRYINTVIQCISNCFELFNYFLKHHSQQDININPLTKSRTNGRLTQVFFNIIKHLWYGEDTENNIYQSNKYKDAFDFLLYLNCIHDCLNKLIIKKY